MLKQGGKGKFTAGGTGTFQYLCFNKLWHNVKWVAVYILVSMEGKTCRRRRKRENAEKGRQNFKDWHYSMFYIMLCWPKEVKYSVSFLEIAQEIVERLPKNKGKQQSP